MKPIFFISVLSLVLSAQFSWAAVPETMSYQGLLTDSGGSSVADGNYSLTFRLYEFDTGGAAVWTETHGSVGVVNGIFNVILGSSTDLNIAFNRQYWLGIAVGAGLELTPRVQLTSAPYALGGNFWKLAGNAGTNSATNFLGTTDDQPLELRVFGARALRLEPETISPNIIGGYFGNAITSGVIGTIIGGGGNSLGINRVTDDYGTVGGGTNNQAGNNLGTTSDAQYATVGGGLTNEASGILSAVGGGGLNKASGGSATVGGGGLNQATGNYATIAGGHGNKATADYATIGGGGLDNVLDPNTGNRVTDNYGTVSGGADNRAGDDAGTTEDAFYATVGGGRTNVASGEYSTVGGGRENDAAGDRATIGGGEENKAEGAWSTVAGGGWNKAGGTLSTVAGGSGNEAIGDYAIVAGGHSNEAIGEYATIGGGHSNEADATGATIAGGGESYPTGYVSRNRVTDNYGTIGGGSYNRAGNGDGDPENASYATVSGGEKNEAKGQHATVGGGYDNVVNGRYSIIPGGYNNEVSGDRSFAAGSMARSSHNGCFVWGDSSGSAFGSSGHNQFRVRASGGTWFYSKGDLSAGVWLKPDNSSWSNASHSSAKRNIRPVDVKDILFKLAQIPISRWSYKAQDPKIEHIGPMSQDFYAAFGLGGDDKYIDTIDPDGVALAAIQGLYELVKEKEAENDALRKRVDSLEARLEALEVGR